VQKGSSTQSRVEKRGMFAGQLRAYMSVGSLCVYEVLHQLFQCTSELIKLLCSGERVRNQQCKHSTKFSASSYLHDLYTDCKGLFVFPI